MFSRVLERQGWRRPGSSPGHGRVTASAATPPDDQSQHGPPTASGLLRVLRDEGDNLLRLARGVDLRRPVRTCPGWTAEDVIRHLTTVYRWVTLIVAQQRTERPSPEERAALDRVERDPLSDLAAAHVRVTEALDRASVSLRCWTIWPSDKSRDYWIRRQAHETVVHRIDVHDAVRGEATSCADVDPLVAADGVDEMVTGFAQRYRSSLRAPRPTTLSLHADDVDRHWWVRLGSAEPELGRGEFDGADTHVHARAGELLMLLWNRREVEGLEVSGPIEALHFWRLGARL